MRKKNFIPRNKKIIPYIFVFCMAILSAVVFTKDIDSAKAAGSIYLNNSSLTLEVGHYSTLKVKGTSQKVTWKSANEKCATVSSGGRVTAMGWGTTTVYATVGGKKLSCKVTVVQMSSRDFTLAPGASKTLSLWGANNTVTWSSSNKSVATVSSDGKVTGKAAGTANITAVLNGKSFTRKVTVIDMDINEKSIVLEYDGKFSLTQLGYGRSKKLKVAGTNMKATWKSSNEAVAAVDSSGKVVAKGAGTATITASVDGASVSCKVTVLKISNNELTLKKGQTAKLSVYGASGEITWDSYKKSVATVAADGTVTAKSAGTAKIVANVNGRLVRCIVTVK